MPYEGQLGAPPGYPPEESHLPPADGDRLPGEAGHARAPGPAVTPGLLAPLVFSSLWIGTSLGVFLPFISIVLAEHGLSVAEVGTVMAIGAVAYVVCVPLLGQVADVATGRPRMLAITGVIGGLGLASIAAGVPPLFTALGYIVGTAFISCWLPLNDAVIVNGLHDPTQYGRIRMLLSLSYALATLAAGFVYAVTGFTASVVALGVGGVGLPLVTHFLPDAPRVGRDTDARGRPGALDYLVRSGQRAFAIAPALPILLLAVALVALGYASGNIFFGLRVVELGGGSVDVALSAGISALVEVPGMIVAGYLGARFGLQRLFAAGALILVLVTAGWALATSVPALIVTRSFSGLGYAFVIVAGVLTIRRILPAELQGTGQTLLQTTCFGVTGIVVSAAGGALHDAIGFAGVFALAAALGFVGIAVGWLGYARALPTDAPRITPPRVADS